LIKSEFLLVVFYTIQNGASVCEPYKGQLVSVGAVVVGVVLVVAVVDVDVVVAVAAVAAVAVAVAVAEHTE
jgi:hypothetical protein